METNKQTNKHDGSARNLAVAVERRRGHKRVHNRIVSASATCANSSIQIASNCSAGSSPGFASESPKLGDSTVARQTLKNRAAAFEIQLIPIGDTLSRRAAYNLARSHLDRRKCKCACPRLPISSSPLEIKLRDFCLGSLRTGRQLSTIVRPSAS